MKKVLKIGSLLSLVAAIGLTSGCACNVKQSKADERAEVFSKQELAYDSDNRQRDFTTTYKSVHTEGTEEAKVTTTTVTVKYDVKTLKMYLKSTVTEKVGDGEEVETDSHIHTFYMENGKVSIKNEKDGTVKTSEYTNPYTLFADNAALLEPKEEGQEALMDYNYYELSAGFYNSYKTAPLNGCTSGEENEVIERAKKLPGILTSSVEEKTCDVEKKLFGKDYTYILSYRLSVSTMTDVEIVVNKDGNLKSFLEEQTISVGREGRIDKVVNEFDVSFDNVD